MRAREIIPDKVKFARKSNYSRRGERCRTNVKLTEEEVSEIRRRLSAGEIVRTIAEDFRVAVSTVEKIKLGDTWYRVDVPPAPGEGE